MSNKTKNVKVDVDIEQRTLDLTTYKISLTVPTNDSIVMEWLASQDAIDSLSSYLAKAVTDYFHQSSKQVKEALASKPTEKLVSKSSAKKKIKSDEKQKVSGD